MSIIVYALTNPAMPGIVKIGQTSRDDVQGRMKELYGTGVPLPFECAIAIEVDDKHDDALEKALHKAFDPSRLNSRREFFQIDAEQVAAILSVWPGGKDVTPQFNEETDETLSSVDRNASKEYKIKRRPNLNFVEMDIPPGSVIVAVKTGEEATVVSERKVSFRGEEMYMTRATKIMLELDYEPAPASHWTFEGQTLNNIYNETYR